MGNKRNPWIKVSETDNFTVEYDSVGKYRVTYFENGHYVDECNFPAYERNQKASRWIVYTELVGAFWHVRRVCPRCGTGYDGNPNADYFCQNCGTKMLGSVGVAFAKYKEKLADGNLEELVE